MDPLESRTRCWDNLEANNPIIRFQALLLRIWQI